MQVVTTNRVTGEDDATDMEQRVAQVKPMISNVIIADSTVLVVANTSTVRDFERKVATLTLRKMRRGHNTHQYTAKLLNWFVRSELKLKFRQLNIKAVVPTDRTGVFLDHNGNEVRYGSVFDGS